MTLTLRIENFDVLENGGPTSITLNQKGCEVGRSKSMDWVLPDPKRHLSGHHFSVEFNNNAYWLKDTSTNGTFKQGSSHRLQGPHQIAAGDRFLVGHYVIVAQLASAAPVMQPSTPTQSRSMLQTPPHVGGGAPASSSPPMMPPAQAAPADDNDPWDFGTPAEPVDPLPPQRADAHHLDDVAQDFVPSVPMPSPTAGSHPPAGFQVSPFQMQQPPVPAPATNADAVFHAFCEGAGLQPADYDNVDVEKLARELGMVVRQSCDEIMTMLQDRAAVKQFTKGGERTMRSATGNNPMKFLPDTHQALETMFLKHRDGFMKGSDGYGNALRDIRRHQSAVFAALQPALASLLSGLSPDDIEDSAGSGILGGTSKSKLWETYVERWDAKAEAGENGLLDAFLVAFAKSYAAAAGRADD